MFLFRQTSPLRTWNKKPDYGWSMFCVQTVWCNAANYKMPYQSPALWLLCYQWLTSPGWTQVQLGTYFHVRQLYAEWFTSCSRELQQKLPGANIPTTSAIHYINPKPSVKYYIQWKVAMYWLKKTLMILVQDWNKKITGKTGPARWCFSLLSVQCYKITETSSV